MKHLALLLAAAIPTLAWSQVGIGTSTPAATAALELSATDKGFLPPRMTAAQRTAIASPATGLMVYQTDGTTGLYVYSGSAWIPQAQWYSNYTTNPSQFLWTRPTGTSTSAYHNIGIGTNALNGLTQGDQNIAIGANALLAINTGGYNTAIGVNSLMSTTNSSYTTAVGRSAGTDAVGTYNTFIGNGTKMGAVSSISNSTAIGNEAEVSASNSIQLGNGSVTQVTTYGSVGIGTTSPNTNAALDIVSTSKGLLLPRLTTAQRDGISGAPAGLLIFNTTDGKVQAYTGSAWVDLH